MLAIPPDVRAAADPISHSPPDRRPFARFAPRDPLLRINELRNLILLELHLKMTLHHHLAQAGSEQSGVGICHRGAHTTCNWPDGLRRGAKQRHHSPCLSTATTLDRAPSKHPEPRAKPLSLEQTLERITNSAVHESDHIPFDVFTPPIVFPRLANGT